MNKFILILSFLFFLFLTGCEKVGSDSGTPIPLVDMASSSSGPGQNGSGTTNQPGVITAGEWNDLDNWLFWGNILQKEEFEGMPGYWSFFNNHRISVNVSGTDAKPAVDVPVKLKRNGMTIFSARTDNQGQAELWVELYQYSSNVDYSKLTIDINNGASVISKVNSFNTGINHAVISQTPANKKIEIAFVVDATGSMGDELEYLKTELTDVLSKAKTSNPTATLLTSSVFYRDEGDEYVTRISPFTTDIKTTVNFIKAQRADGGGDFPEAVHTALDKATNELRWSEKAHTRLLFLILDAPPHYEKGIVNNIHSSVRRASENGIKIIPITASGIDKETEFLMRFMSVTTNGTYVFITNHSGIGNDHLEPTVGEYEVEFLNNLMVRLINKYAR